MRRHLIIFVAMYCLVSSQGIAQDIPPRFEPLAKNERFRLLRVLGAPEMPASFNPNSAFSADGKFAIYAEDLSGGAEDMPRLRTRLLLWDVNQKKWPREFEIAGKNVTALSLSSDGSKVLLAGLTLPGIPIKDDKKKSPPDPVAYLTLFDLNTGKQVHGFLTKEEFISSVALAPDGVTCFTSASHGVKRWDLKAGKELDAFPEKDMAFAQTLALLPDGKHFLASYFGGSKDKSMSGVLRWEIGKPKPFAYANKAKELAKFWHLAASRDGKRFAAGDVGQHAITLWETDTGKQINAFSTEQKNNSETITALAVADDGKTVLSLWEKFSAAAEDDFTGSRLIAWDGDANKVLWSHIVPYRGRVPMLVQGDKLLLGGGPNLFEVWSIKDGKRLETWGGHKGTIHAVTVLPNEDILSVGQEGEVLTWRQGQVAKRQAAHVGSIAVLALSSDRKQWLTGGADQVVKLWSGDADKPVHLLKGHKAPVTSVAFSKAGRWACSGSADRAAKTWDLATGKEIATLAGHSEGVNAVAISPDELWLATGSDDATIRVWPIKNGKLDADREALVLEGHKKPVICLAFSADGKSLLSGSQDHTMKVWDWAKEKATRTIPGHKNWVTSVLFLDEKTVLTTSDDLSICLWEVNSGKEIGRVDFGAVGDCPRCVTRLGADRLLVGTSSWLIYEFQMLPAGKSKAGAGSSK